MNHSHPLAKVWTLVLMATVAVAATVPAPAGEVPPPLKVRAGLKIEDLGAPIQRRELQGMHFYPDAKGVHHVFFQVAAFNGFEDDPPVQFVDFNLQTGEVREAMLDRVNGIGKLWAHPNGKLYVAGCRPSSLIEYDPATGTPRYVGMLTPNFYHAVQSGDIGPDGALYFGTYGRHACRYDPRTDKIKDFGAMNGTESGYVYSIAADGRYVYCGISDHGKWYIVICDMNTGTQEVHEDWKGGVRRDAQGRIFAAGRLMKDGKAVKPEDVEAVKKTAVKVARNAALSITAAEKAFGYEFDISDVNPTTWNNGRVGLRWRPKGAEEWASAVFEGVKVVPNVPTIMAATEDGKIIGMGGHYGPLFLFDPTTGKSDLIGHSPCSINAFLAKRDVVYFVGYSAQWWIWDRTKPWTMRGKGAGYAEGAEPNPVNITGAGKWPARIVEAFDGTLFCAGNYGRHLVGGEVVYYDPKTRERVSWRKEFEPYSVSDLLVMPGGKTIACTAVSRDEKKTPTVFLIDVPTRSIARKVEFQVESGNPGKVMPVGGSAILGVNRITRKDEKTGATTQQTFIYKLDLESGKVLFQKTLPGRAFSGPTEFDYKGAHRELSLGPDGCGWFCIDKDMVRLRPDGEIEKVMALPHGVRMVWYGNDLYLYGSGRQWYGGFASIWRIRDVFEK